MGKKPTYEALIETARVLENELASIKEKVEQYSRLVENSYDVPYEIAYDGTITYVGPQITHLGYEPEEVISRNYLDFVAPDQLQVWKKLLEKMRKNRKDNPLEYKWQGKNGKYYWVETIGKNLYDDDGRFITRIGVMRDISERKKTEEILRESEEKFRLITENSGEGIWQLDLEGKLTFFMAPMQKLFGYSYQELAGRSFHTFFPDSELERVKQVFNRATSGETYQLFEINAKRADGSIIPVEVSVAPAIKGGKIVGAQGIVRDITNRSKIRDEIANQKYIESELSQLATYLLTSTQIPDISYQVLESALRLTKSRYGYVGSIDTDKAQFMGYAMNRDAWDDCAIPEKASAFEKHSNLWESILKNYEPVIENHFKDRHRPDDIPDGHIAIDAFLSVPAMIGDQLVGQIVLANPERPYSETDLVITERIATLYTMAIQRQKYEIALVDAESRETEKLEEMVKQRTAELENAKDNLEQEVMQRLQIEQELAQADKMISLGILVSGVAHEINNPNNFIMLNAPLLKDVWQSIIPVLENHYSRQGDFMVAGLPYSEMKSEVPHLLNGIEEGARRIQRIVKDLKEYSRRDQEIMEESISINDVIRQSIKLLDPLIKKSTRKFSVTYDANLPMIKGNSQKLGQVVVNLVQNACQAIPDIEKGIYVATSLDEKMGDVIIAVEDEGVGIPENIIPHIMDPFFTTKRDTGGTGLGLAVSANIIKEHGGKLEVSSETGKNSVFKVRLPIRAKDAQKKILIVDDDRGTREMIYKALNKYGDYAVQKVSTGTEASVKLGIEKPDLVILDMQMPDMNGVEICRLINISPELSGIKVLIITGYPNSIKVKEAAQLGFKHVVAKPFHIKEFLEVITQVIEEK